jgi:hypothetical protein
MIAATSSSSSCSLLKMLVVERDLAARHAKRVELLRAEQVDLPLPVLASGLQSDVYGMMRWAIAQPHLAGSLRSERLLARCLLQHLPVLLGRRLLDLLRRNHLGERALLALGNRLRQHRGRQPRSNDQGGAKAASGVLPATATHAMPRWTHDGVVNEEVAVHLGARAIMTCWDRAF